MSGLLPINSTGNTMREKQLLMLENNPTFVQIGIGGWLCVSQDGQDGYRVAEKL